MNKSEFKSSISNQSPSKFLPKALLALWRHKKGDWDKAQTIVQSENTTCCAWVHALLHKEDGDAGNTSY